MTLSRYTPEYYDGDGSTISFAITFRFWQDSDIKVVHVDASGTETNWSKGTHYTLVGGNGSTGTLNVITTPTDYTPASGERIVILSVVPTTQPTKFPVGGPIPSASLEQQLDQSVRQIQQSEDTLNRALKLPDSTNETVSSTLLTIEGNGGRFVRARSDEAGFEYATVTATGGAVVSDDNPQALATSASSGTSDDIARADHVHPIPTVGAGLARTSDQITLDPTGATGATVATGDTFLFADADDSDAIKKDTIQGIIDLVSSNAVPAGAMMDFGGTAAGVPSGWLACDGSEVSRTTYSDLFAVISTIYGVGDGSTTFNLPDFRGRSAIGVNDSGLPNGESGSYSTRNEADNGGEESHALTTGELAAHSHSDTFAISNDGSHTHSFSLEVSGFNTSGSGGSQLAFSNSVSTARTASVTGSINSAGLHSHGFSGSVSSAGSGTAHNTMHPFLVVNKIIKT